MKKARTIKKLAKDLFCLEKERDTYHMELVADASNADASQNFSRVSDKIESIREDIRFIKEELQE